MSRKGKRRTDKLVDRSAVLYRFQTTVGWLLIPFKTALSDTSQEELEVLYADYEQSQVDDYLSVNPSVKLLSDIEVSKLLDVIGRPVLLPT